MDLYQKPFKNDRGLWNGAKINLANGHVNTYRHGHTKGKEKKMSMDRNKTNNDSDSVASLDSTGKRKSFRRLFERFAEKTSMQGIPYIHMAKLIWAKLIWTVLLVGAVAGMIVHLKYLIDNYMRFEKSTKIELGRDNLRFPAITICNTNIIKESSLFDLQEAATLKDLIDAMKPENLAPDNFGGETPVSNQGTNQDGATGTNTGTNQAGNPPTGNTNGGQLPTQSDGGAGQAATPTSSPVGGVTSPGGQSGTGRPPQTSTPPNEQSKDGTGRPPPTPSSTDGQSQPPNGQSPPADGQSPPPDGQSQPPNGQNPPPRVRRQEPSPSNNNNNQPSQEHRPPLYNFNLSAYDSDFNDYLESLELEDDEYDSPLDVQSEVYNLFTYLYMNLNKKKRASIGHNITEMLVSCSFGERICHPNLFTLHQTSEYGNCWTISSRKFISSKPGPRGGMELVLYLQLEEYLKGITNGYGIRLVIHHPDTFPFPYDEGLFIPAAMETDIGLRLRTITRAGPPHGECNEGIDYKKRLKIAYTRQACQTTCRIFKLLEQCGCWEDGTEEIALSQIKDAHPCRSKQEERCMIDLLRKFQRNEETCECLNPCHEVEYVQAISQRQWPTDEYAKVLLESACYLDETACDQLQQKDNRLLNYNFLKLNIYYADLNFENVTETPDIETVQFLSDVGGAIGLWIGLSLLSLCELGQLLIELFIYFVDRTRHSGERRERQREKQRNKKLKEMVDEPNHAHSNGSRGPLSVPDIKFDLESGSGRDSSREDRFRNSPHGSPHIRRFKDDRSQRVSPRGSPWLDRRGMEPFGMHPPTRYYSEY